MTHYSIRELEHLSGIKAHTLRIWENRYKILQPKRTDTNIRYYTEADLKLLLKIALLNKHGLRISKIAKMSSEELNKEVGKLSENLVVGDYQIHLLTNAMIDMNEIQFEDVMDENINFRGFEQTMTEVIYPFLEKIGILWLSGSINPAQEHFITNLIRQKIIVGINNLPRPQNTSERYILFTPENELHELSLLFAHYMLKARGKSIVYLGAGVPTADVVTVAKARKPNYLFCISTSHPVKRKMQRFVSELDEGIAKSTQVIMTGYQASRINFPLPENFRVVHKVSDLFKLSQYSYERPM